MKRGLVVAGATGWREELAALEELVGGPFPGIVIGVNDAGTVLERIDELCTLHHDGRTGWNNEPPKPWGRIREENGLPPVKIVACANSSAWPIDETWNARETERDSPWTDGSSGLYGTARLLLHYGCDRIVLVGVRMDEEPNDFRDEERWAHHGRYWRGWEKRYDRLKPHVRSMSGRTMRTFGKPTREWLGLETLDRSGQAA